MTMRQKIKCLAKEAAKSNQGGFTLIELILVTVIIGILAGMVALNIGNVGEDARLRAAKGDIATIETAVDLYFLNNPGESSAPSVEELKSKKLLKEAPKDPWGGEYTITGGPEDFEVSSSKGGIDELDAALAD